MSDSTLRVEGLTTGYDKVNVLHDVSIEVPPGKITCILGANGAGKSTLIRSILGLTPPRQGRILWDGTDIAKELTRALASVDDARAEYSKGYPKISIAPAVGSSQSSDISDSYVADYTADGKDFVSWMKIGLAFSLPLIVFGLIVLIVIVSRIK